MFLEVVIYRNLFIFYDILYLDFFSAIYYIINIMGKRGKDFGKQKQQPEPSS